MRNSFSSLTSVCALLLVASAAKADVISSESFSLVDYSVGSIFGQAPNAGSGWSGGWSQITGTGNIVSQGLSYAGYHSTGGAVEYSGGVMERLFANSFTSGTIYMGFLIQPTSFDPPLGGGVFGMSLRETANDGGFARPRWGDFANAQNRWQLQTSETGQSGGQIFTSTVPITLNQTALIVTRVDLNSNGSNDRIRVYVNPTAAGEPVAADLDIASKNIGTPQEINLTSFLNNNGITRFDEIRTSTTYNSLFTGVPEPGTSLLLVISALGFVFRRSSRICVID